MIALHVPRPAIGATDSARAVADVARESTKPVLGAWLGAVDRREVDAALEAGGDRQLLHAGERGRGILVPRRLSAQPGVAARSAAAAARCRKRPTWLVRTDSPARPATHCAIDDSSAADVSTRCSPPSVSTRPPLRSSKRSGKPSPREAPAFPVTLALDVDAPGGAVATRGSLAQCVGEAWGELHLAAPKACAPCAARMRSFDAVITSGRGRAFAIAVAQDRDVWTSSSCCAAGTSRRRCTRVGADVAAAQSSTCRRGPGGRGMPIDEAQSRRRRECVGVRSAAASAR